MKAKLVKQWVAALRSGKYKKSYGALRTKEVKNDTFCCLGVLCDIIAPNAWEYSDNRYFHKTASSDLGLGSLSNELGITDSEQYALITLNDRKKKSFSYIASRIEKMFA